MADKEMEQMIDEMVRSCMDDPDALSCAIETIQMIPPETGCRPELLFFTQDDCVVCPVDRNKYASLIAEGVVREVDATSPEGQRIMNANNLHATPTLALIDCAGKLIGEFFDSNIVEGENIST